MQYDRRRSRSDLSSDVASDNGRTSRHSADRIGKKRCRCSMTTCGKKREAPDLDARQRRCRREITVQDSAETNICKVIQFKLQEIRQNRIEPFETGETIELSQKKSDCSMRSQMCSNIRREGWFDRFEHCQCNLMPFLITGAAGLVVGAFV